jgi:hypothetical protein
MKTVLTIALIAMLLLATGTAHAYDAELPDQMFGAWCQTNNLALDRALPNNEFYSKCENGYLFIFDKGLKYKAGGSCEFASIKFDRREDAYDVFVVRANCKGIVDAKGNPYLYSEINPTLHRKKSAQASSLRATKVQSKQANSGLYASEAGRVHPVIVGWSTRNRPLLPRPITDTP